MKHRLPAVHWSSVGMPDAPDSEIMAYARDQAMIVFTHDLDFSALLFHTKAKSPSVIQIRGEEIRPDKTAALVINAINESKEALEAGALLTVDAKRHRLIVLPLHG